MKRRKQRKWRWGDRDSTIIAMLLIALALFAYGIDGKLSWGLMKLPDCVGGGIEACQPKK